MIIRASHAFWQLAVILALFPLSASAQVATGSPPFASIGGGAFDTVNLANLNVHFGIPVVNKAGRGIPFSYTLVYDSSDWYPVTSGSTQVWTPVANFGWAGQTQASTGYVSYFAGTTECFDGHNHYSMPTANAFVYHDSFGATHSFSTGVLGGCTGKELIVASNDGSGYTIDAGVGLGTIYTRSGQTINPPLNTGTGSGTAVDSNGNEITVSGSTFTDTLGTTALTISGQGTSTSPLQFQYTSPHGTPANVTLNYTLYNVKTAFGCGGISEFSQNGVSLVSSVSLPDGTSYSIQYEQTPGNTGFVTGRIHSITLPTTGTIYYTYSGGSNGSGIVCADGSTATLGRQTPDGTWSYAHSESGPAWTTLITDPQSNQTNMSFQGIYETERQIYQGSTAGTLLKTLITCYNGNMASCNTAAITQPITQRTVTLQWPGTGGRQAKTNTLYNNFGLVTENDEYDYGSGAPGGLVRQTLVPYATLGNNLSNRPASVTLKDGSGNIKAQTSYGYDQTPVSATSGTPQHLTVGSVRGNATTIAYLVQGSSTQSRTFTYYDTGTTQTATDLNGASTTYTYGTGSCGNSFATSISLPLSLLRSIAWNCTGGVQTAITDENSKTISYTLNDPFFWRPNAVVDQISNVTNLTYSGANSVESSLLFGGGSTLDELQTLDPLGRPYISQVRQGPSSSTYDTVETTYDSNGRLHFSTLPYGGTAGQATLSAPSTNFSYDALGRKYQVTDSGGKTVTFTYFQNDIYQTTAPAPTGENPKRAQFEYDALGNLTSVCEVTSGLGSGTCGQAATATGYWTKYTYDALGDLTSVTQNAQSSSTQARASMYDGLGRMTSETNPESGTTSYVYDSDSTCGSYVGDLVKKADAQGNTTCYSYDALHRPTSVIVNSGPYSGTITPKKYFVYDAATVNSIAMVNTKGRLAEAYTCTAPCTSKLTDTGFSYTARGEVSDIHESTPDSGGYYHVSQSYWANGAVDIISGSSGLPSITYTPDGEGRVYSVSASSGQNPVISTTYNVASLPLQLNLGSLDGDSFTYDLNTNRMTQFKFTVNGQSVIGNLGWNANGTLSTLGITDPFNSANTQNCSYAHDDLSRIVSANCGTPWSQTFSYTADGSGGAFGNLSKNGSSMFQPTYSPTTNQMTQIGSSTPTYDSNGNVTNDFLHTYAWDAAGRPVTVDGGTLTYDALGRMVENSSGAFHTEFVYGPTGAMVGIAGGQTIGTEFVPLPGGGTAVYSSGVLAYYGHADWLGSRRFASTPSRTMYFSVAYGPYGETYSRSGNAGFTFTGQNQLTSGNLYDFPAREYGIQGRWPSPDPAGLAAVDLSDPQTLNRYAYVRNSPLRIVDPSGMVNCYPTEVCGGEGGGGSCPSEICGDPLYDPFFGGGGGGGGGDRPIVPAPAPETVNWHNLWFDPNAGLVNGYGEGDAAVLLPFCVAQPEICIAVAAGTTIVYIGVKVHEGVKNGTIKLPTIPWIQLKKGEGALLDDIAKRFCVDRNNLGLEVEENKRMRGMPRGAKLSKKEIEDIAREMPKIPGCVPTGS